MARDKGVVQPVGTEHEAFADDSFESRLPSPVDLYGSLGSAGLELHHQFELAALGRDEGNDIKLGDIEQLGVFRDGPLGHVNPSDSRLGMDQPLWMRQGRHGTRAAAENKRAGGYPDSAREISQGHASGRSMTPLANYAASDSPVTTVPPVTVAFSRTAAFTFSASSGFSRSSCLAASRPWPTSSP